MAIINGTTGDDKFENSLFGTEEAAEIFGLKGKDRLVGLAGGDMPDDGAGNRNRVSYGDSPSGINANLATGVVSDSNNVLEPDNGDFFTDLDGGDGLAGMSSYSTCLVGRHRASNRNSVRLSSISRFPTETAWKRKPASVLTFPFTRGCRRSKTRLPAWPCSTGLNPVSLMPLTRLTLSTQPRWMPQT